MNSESGTVTAELAIAMPAWLAAQGADAGDIGSYLAVIYLPWAFKLIVGPLMDRYQFPAMGSRRAWVLVAQLGLTFSQLRSIRYHTRDLGIGYCGGGGGMLFRANME